MLSVPLTALLYRTDKLQMMTGGEDNNDGRIGRAGFSIRNRVIAGFASITLAFAGLMLYSIFLYQKTVAELSLINTTYLPLTLGTSDVRATQLVFNTLMDRLEDDPNPTVTRDWINAARRYRPATRSRRTRVIHRALRKEIPVEEAQFLGEMQLRLDEVRKRYRENESKFTRLYADMDVGHRESAMLKIEELKRAERLLDKVLAGIESELNKHITDVSEEAELKGERAVWGLGAMTLGAILLGLLIGIFTHRRLAPLKRLQGAVALVAKGELSTHIEVKGQDEIGALAQAFNRMTDALADRDQMLIRSERLATAGKMAAQVTHEIRNPLSSLGLNADLLGDELGTGPDSQEARDLLSAMQDEIERLTGITESYLRFARLPSPEPEFSNLNTSIEASLEFMKTELQGRGVKHNTALQEDLPPMFFDRGQMRQALTNLLRNACEAMPEGGTISLSTRTGRDHTVEMSISDTGKGIPDGEAGQIFDSFYTTKSGGTGLGLAMVRQICLAHGGEIVYEDRDGPGSTFTIKLPASEPGGDREVPKNG